MTFSIINKKWFQVENDIIIACGECSDIYELETDWLTDQFKDLSCEFMLIRNQTAFYGYVKNTRKHIEPLSYNFAIGSGEQWAIAAMDFNKNAIEAIEYAKVRDFRTGGKVHILYYSQATSR